MTVKRQTISDFKLDIGNLFQQPVEQVKDPIQVQKDVDAINLMISAQMETSRLQGYDALRNRFVMGNITASELMTFMDQNKLTSEALNKYLLEDRAFLLRALNLFFTVSSKSISDMTFCSLVQSGVFGMIKKFDPQKILQDLKENPIAGLLNNIKSQMDQMVEDIFDKARSQLQSMMTSVQAIMSDIKSHGVAGAIMKRVDRQYQIASAALSEVVESFSKDKVQEYINKFVNDIKNITPENIEAMASMVCKLSGKMNDIISNPVNALGSIVDTFDTSRKQARKMSDANTKKVVQSGGIRYGATERAEARKQAEGNFKPQAASRRPIVPPTPEEIANITKWVHPGNGDDRIGFGGGLSAGAAGRDGWERVSTDLRVIVMRLQKKMGRKLIVNSGYRSPARNAKVGGASKSYHMSGLAVDIIMPASEQSKFANMARAEGCGGIGYYRSRGFIHLDLGPERTWGG